MCSALRLKKWSLNEKAHLFPLAFSWHCNQTISKRNMSEKALHISYSKWIRLRLHTYKNLKHATSFFSYFTQSCSLDLFSCLLDLFGRSNLSGVSNICKVYSIQSTTTNVYNGQLNWRKKSRTLSMCECVCVCDRYIYIVYYAHETTSTIHSWCSLAASLPPRSSHVWEWYGSFVRSLCHLTVHICQAYLNTEKHFGTTENRYFTPQI